MLLQYFCTEKILIYKMKKNKILFVDDEKDILEFLGYYFSYKGFEVFKSTNGKEAIEIAKSIVPHIIILDIMMPEMNGFITCCKLRELKSLDNTIIAFLSAKGDAHSQVKGFKFGADDFFQKPIKPQIIVDRLRELQSRKINNHFI